jgi:hypothetical protein
MKFTSPNPERLSKPIAVRLPVSIAAAWGKTVGGGDDAAFFARYAIAAFMLREGFAKPSDCGVLPFKVWGADGAPCYQLAPTIAAATAMARAEGLTVVQVERGWL